MGSRLLSGFLRRQEASIFVVALLLIAWFESANHDFLLSSPSLQNLSQYIAPAAIIACGEVMLMIGGEIDLSAGMVYAFAPFIMHFAADAGVPMFVALLIGLLAAGCIGLVNGAKA
jgi:simple sugar transport system permease protein